MYYLSVIARDLLARFDAISKETLTQDGLLVNGVDCSNRMDLGSPDLSVVVVNWNTSGLLRQCLSSVITSLENDLADVTVVDNASSDDSVALVRNEFPTVRLIENDSNVGFARANNQGINASGGRYVLLLNSDTIVRPGALAGLVEFMESHPDAGACGPRLILPSGTPQPYSFGYDPTIVYLLKRGLKRLLTGRYLHDWATDQVTGVDWVSGACMMLRRAALDQVGLLDERIFMYFEDNDLCSRLRRWGWRVYYNPRVSIVHLGGQSLVQNPVAKRAYHESLRYFYAKHYGPLAQVILRVGLGAYRRLGR